jgi:hypothetical protein
MSAAPGVGLRHGAGQPAQGAVCPAQRPQPAPGPSAMGPRPQPSATAVCLRHRARPPAQATHMGVARVGALVPRHARPGGPHVALRYRPPSHTPVPETMRGPAAGGGQTPRARSRHQARGKLARSSHVAGGRLSCVSHVACTNLTARPPRSRQAGRRLARARSDLTCNRNAAEIHREPVPGADDPHEPARPPPRRAPVSATAGADDLAEPARPQPRRSRPQRPHTSGSDTPRGS